MKYLFIAVLIILFSQNIYADEVVNEGSELIENTETVQSEPVTESSFRVTNIELSTVEYYNLADGSEYKPKERIIIGGVVPFIPIRSTIDKSVEDPGLVQKSVSFLLYFKQNF